MEFMKIIRITLKESGSSLWSQPIEQYPVSRLMQTCGSWHFDREDVKRDLKQSESRQNKERRRTHRIVLGLKVVIR